MKMHRQSLTARRVIVSLLSLATFTWAEAATARHAGVVVSVDKAAGPIVVGDLGPKLRPGSRGRCSP